MDAARRAGVGHVVKQSVPWAGADAPVVVSRWHGQIEESLTASGLPAVILRPGFFMSNLLTSAEQVRRDGKLSAPAGTARIAMIDPRDVAAVAVTTLTTPGAGGEADVLTGPEALNYEQIAHQLSVVTGRPIEFVTVSDEAARHGMAEAGTPTWLVELFGMFRAGAAARTTGAVRAVTGREPRTFAHDHVAAVCVVHRIASFDKVGPACGTRRSGSIAESAVNARQPDTVRGWIRCVTRSPPVPGSGRPS